MRYIRIDIHRDSCEVAIAEEGRVHSAGRFSTQPDEVGLWTQSLRWFDVVNLEAT